MATNVFSNRSTDYDGSPSGDNDVYTATGSVAVTFSGTSRGLLEVFSRSGTADYALTHAQASLGRFKMNLPADDEYYFKVYGIEPGGSLDLSIADY